MRIAFVLPGRGLFGGIRIVANYGEALRRRGHDVRIVYFVRKPRGVGRRLKAWLMGRCSTTPTGGDYLDDFGGELLAADPVGLSAAVGENDVVIATHWMTADPVAALPDKAGAKHYFVQGYEVYNFDPEEVNATWRLPLRKLTVSSWLRDLAEERFGDPDAVWTPNGVDTDLFDAPARDLRNPPTVGVTYSPAKWKGSAVAFEAMRRARERVPSLQLIGFGATEPDELPEGMAFHVRPEQDRLREIYATADVWLLASETEGFGLPALEALACRTPVVVTRCQGTEDFVEDGGNGYLVDVGDARAMAERIVSLVSDSGLWKRMSDEAYATRERFSLSHAVESFEAALTAGAGIEVQVESGR